MRAIACIPILTLLVSCSQPFENPRMGMLDDLASLEPAHRGANRKEASLEEYGPAAWRWPLEEVVVTSNYGKRGRRFHDGLDLRASLGTPVHAVREGEVVHSGRRIPGYGRMVILRHDDGFYSVYAHHSQNLVTEGQKVKMGQKIALSGRSGRVRGPHLHFELRKGTDPLNPVDVLP